MSFKVGDRVKVYDICQATNISTSDKGLILKVYLNGRLFVQMENWGTNPDNTYWFHEKQCRKLVKKTIKYPKKLSKDFGFGSGITIERYRQMKLKLRNRWKQVAALEKELSRCATEIGQVLELSQRQSYAKEDVTGWLQYIYDYWKKYE